MINSPTILAIVQAILVQQVSVTSSMILALSFKLQADIS